MEFAYNSGYQESLKMSPFEDLYGRRFNTPIRWNDLVNKMLISPEMLQEMQQEIYAIKNNLKATDDK